MPPSVHSAMRGRWKKLRLDDFAFSYPLPPPAKSIPSIDHHTCLHRQRHPEVKSWPHLFQCPAREHPIQSAFWPFSLFTRRKETGQGDATLYRSLLIQSQDTREIQHDVQFLKNEIESLKISSSRRNKNAERVDSRITSLELRSKATDEDAAKMRDDIESIKSKPAQAKDKPFFESQIKDLVKQMKATREDIHALKSTSGQEKKRSDGLEDQIKQLEKESKADPENAAVMKEINTLKSTYGQEKKRSDGLEDQLKRLEKQSKAAPEDTTKNGRTLKSNYTREKSYRLESQIKYLQGRLTRLESGLSPHLEIDEISTAEPIEDPEEESQLSSGSDSNLLPIVYPVEFSPESHLKYVRQIEDKFGFKFENHALVWQALQFKRGSLREAENFNKLLALEGDAALKLALITKAIEDGSGEAAAFSLGQLGRLQSNRHLLQLARAMGLHKLTFSTPNIGHFVPTPNPYSETVLGTTMEAIFSVIYRQGGISALCDVLDFIGYENAKGPTEQMTEKKIVEGAAATDTADATESPAGESTLNSSSTDVIQSLSETQEVPQETVSKVVEPPESAESSEIAGSGPESVVSIESAEPSATAEHAQTAAENNEDAKTVQINQISDHSLLTDPIREEPKRNKSSPFASLRQERLSQNVAENIENARTVEAERTPSDPIQEAPKRNKSSPFEALRQEWESFKAMDRTGQEQNSIDESPTTARLSDPNATKSVQGEVSSSESLTTAHLSDPNTTNSVQGQEFDGESLTTAHLSDPNTTNSVHKEQEIEESNLSVSLPIEETSNTSKAPASIEHESPLPKSSQISEQQELEKVSSPKPDILSAPKTTTSQAPSGLSPQALWYSNEWQKRLHSMRTRGKTIKSCKPGERTVVQEYLKLLENNRVDLTNRYIFQEFAIEKILLTRAQTVQATPCTTKHNQKVMEEADLLRGLARDFKNVLSSCRESADGVDMLISLCSAHIDALMAELRPGGIGALDRMFLVERLDALKILSKLLYSSSKVAPYSENVNVSEEATAEVAEGLEKEI